jgi:hypothetical protein
MKRDVLGGGQPCGLAAASARGRRPPSAGGGPTKYHRLAFGNSLHGIGIIASGRLFVLVAGVVRLMRFWAGERNLIIPFAIKNLLNEERCFGRRPALRAGRRLQHAAASPPRAGRRPCKVPPTRIQKLYYIYLRPNRSALCRPPFHMSFSKANTRTGRISARIKEKFVPSFEGAIWVYDGALWRHDSEQL